MLSNIKVILLLILMISSNCFAEKFKPYFGKSYGCELDVVEAKASLNTILECDGKKHLESSEFLDNRFLRWGVAKTKNDIYVLIFLTKGAHGEKVVVYSKTKKDIVKEIKSSWPIEFKNNKEFKLEYKLDSDENGEYKSHYFHLK